MTVEYAIRSLALADSQITASIATRWYPKPAPEGMNTYPYVDYQKIDTIPAATHNNVDRSQIAPGFAKTRLQLTLWGLTYDQIETLCNHFRRVLRDYKGTTGSPAVRIDRIEWLNDRDEYDEIVQKRQRIIDLMIQHATDN